MANIGAYSRHRMFEEMNSPLFTNKGDGATPLVYSPAEQRALAQANLGVTVPLAVGGAALFRMPTPATATATATLTATQVLNGLILATPAAAANYTLPLAADIVAALPDMAIGDAFEFNIVNLSSVALNDITIVTNTGWTITGGGDMVIDAADDTAGAYPRARFWARKTGTATFQLYRIGS